MRGKSRKVYSGPESVPKAPRRPEPSPLSPRLAANAPLSGLKGRFGVSRGARKPFGVLAPFVSAGRPRHPPAAEGGHSPRHVMAHTPRLGRAILACGGRPPERRKGSPSAEGKAEKGAHRLHRLRRCIGVRSAVSRRQKERGDAVRGCYQQVCQLKGLFFLEKCCIFPCAVCATYSIIE